MKAAEKMVVQQHSLSTLPTMPTEYPFHTTALGPATYTQFCYSYGQGQIAMQSRDASIQR